MSNNNDDNPDTNQGAGRSLGGGASESLPVSWNRPANTGPRVGRIGDLSGTGSSSNSGGTGSRFGTIGGLSSGGGSAPRPRRSNEDDESNSEGETWYAGGERSGISVQNPGAQRSMPGGRAVRDILRAATARPPPEEAARSTVFSGGGHKLGSDEVESTYVPDPNAESDEERELVQRKIYLWRNGLSVEDGPLLRFDDPANAEIIRQLQTGVAPMSLLGVQFGQRVDVNLVQRLNEDYNPQTLPSRPFGGAGNRLGAPVPEVTSRQEPAVPGAFPAGSQSESGGSSSGERSSLVTLFEVDQTKPTTSVQIRLADGTRMVCRMNLDHTVLDLRNFINASRPENLSRAYTIGTTFPNRTLDDDSATIEAAGLKNSVVVQRWV